MWPVAAKRSSTGSPACWYRPATARLGHRHRSLAGRPERRRAMGGGAGRRRERFDKAIVLERTLALYRDSLGPSQWSVQPISADFLGRHLQPMLCRGDWIVRHLGSDMNPIQAAFVRYAIGVALLLPTCWRCRVAPGALRLAPHALRGLTHGIGVMLWFFAMTQILSPMLPPSASPRRFSLPSAPPCSWASGCGCAV